MENTEEKLGVSIKQELWVQQATLHTSLLLLQGLQNLKIKEDWSAQ